MKYLVHFLIGVILTVVWYNIPPRADGIQEYAAQQEEHFIVYIGYDTKRPKTTHTGNPGMYANSEWNRHNKPARLVWTATNREDAMECSKEVYKFLLGRKRAK